MSALLTTDGMWACEKIGRKRRQQVGKVMVVVVQEAIVRVRRATEGGCEYWPMQRNVKVEPGREVQGYWMHRHQKREKRAQNAFFE